MKPAPAYLTDNRLMPSGWTEMWTDVTFVRLTEGFHMAVCSCACLTLNGTLDVLHLHSGLYAAAQHTPFGLQA